MSAISHNSLSDMRAEFHLLFWLRIAKKLRCVLAFGTCDALGAYMILLQPGAALLLKISMMIDIFLTELIIIMQEEGIKTCAKAVLFLDVAWLASFNCLQELAYAMKYDKPMVIVVLDQEAWTMLTTPDGAQKVRKQHRASSPYCLNRGYNCKTNYMHEHACLPAACFFYVV